MGLISKIRADVIVGRLLENFNELKKLYPNEPEKIYWGLFFTILKPIKPFKYLSGNDISYMVDQLTELKDIERGFKLLCIS